MEAPFRRAFDAALNPLAARNALGIEEGGGGGGTGAPTNAQYIVAAADPVLTNERVLTDTATVTWDFTVAGQAKATAVGAGGGGGNVSNSGTPTLGQYAKWTTATTIQGVAPSTVLSDIGAQPAGNYQPLDADLTSLAAAAATGVIYYRSAANTWSPITVTAPVTFTGGTLSADLSAYLTSAAAAATYQPLDADLTSLAAASAINAIYYRSAANTWATVTIGTGLSFTSGTLASTVSAGGNVSNSGTPVAGQVAEWVTATTIQGVSTYAKLASPTFTGDPKAPTPIAGDNDTSIATTAFVTAAVASAGGAVPISTVVAYASELAPVPAKWLICDGANYNRTTYAALFAQIGTRFGPGDGSTTFAVPDLRGRTIAGWDFPNSNRLNNNWSASSGNFGVNGTVFGAAGGLEYHALKISEMEPHVHTVGYDGNIGSQGGFDYFTASGTTPRNNTSAAGGGAAHNNTQPTLVLKFMIYAGV